MSNAPGIVLCRKSPDVHPYCAVCRELADEYTFRFHNNSDESYYFCPTCSHVPQIDLWVMNGYILEWLEYEAPQERLI